MFIKILKVIRSVIVIALLTGIAINVRDIRHSLDMLVLAEGFKLKVLFGVDPSEESK